MQRQFIRQKRGQHEFSNVEIENSSPTLLFSTRVIAGDKFIIVHKFVWYFNCSIQTGFTQGYYVVIEWRIEPQVDSPVAT